VPHLPLIVWILFGASVVSVRLLLFVERWGDRAPDDEDEVFEIQLPPAPTIRTGASRTQAEPSEPRGPAAA
jgi:hypothetical protein